MKKLESLKSEKFFSKENLAKADLKFIVAGTQIRTGETKGLDTWSYEWTSATQTDIVGTYPDYIIINPGNPSSR